MRQISRLLALFAGAAFAVACSVGPAAPRAPASPGSPGSLGSPAPGQSAAVAGGDAWLVAGRTGEPGLRVLLASTLEEIYRSPAGIPDATWGHLITATPRDGTTLIEDRVVQPGGGGGSQSIEGAWRLPTVGLDPMPVGVSTDRSTLVLVEDGPSGAWAEATATRFAIVSMTLDRAPRVIELPGSFEFDALSPDGSRLYVAQHVPGPLEDRYQVRVVTTATGVMDEAVIVDKRNLDAAMAGRPIDQARRASGLVLTLYRGAEHPFIHALDSVEAWAVCIDLPARGMHDAAAAADWGVVWARDGAAILAINATLGLVVDIHPTELTVRRVAELEPVARAGVELAKFGHQAAGEVGRRVVASPDGRTIFAGGRGVTRIDAEDLAVLGRSLEARPVEAIAITPDGTTLYALVGDAGRIAKIDAASGEVLGWVDGDGFDRLVAVVPW